MNRILALFTGLALLTGCQSPSVSLNGIPQLSPINIGAHQWRGGQPDATGAAFLKSQGVTRRLKLNTEAEGSDDAIRAEGIEVRYSPITLAQQLGLVAIPKAQIRADVAYLAAGPCFVGCERGEDRTGLVVACYRVTAEGWSKKQARAEMREHHFHPWLLGLTFFWWDW